MEQRLSMVTLGVTDLAASTDFYRALGWSEGASPEGIVFFQAGGLIVALWDRSALAVDSGVEEDEDAPGGGWGGITLAQNVTSSERVDEVIAEATAAGATLTRTAAPTFWGGYSGAFTDPDGHTWEIAHNPYWTITEDGQTVLGAGGLG